MCVHNARERWLRTRLENPEKLKDATAAYWNALFPRWKERLARTIGDQKYNERHFGDVWEEVYPGVEGEDERERKIFTCELIFGAVDIILEEENFFFSLMDVEYGGERGFFKEKQDGEVAFGNP